MTGPAPVTLRPGGRYRSTACTTEVIAVKGTGPIDLRCGGRPMVEAEATPPPGDGSGTAPAPGFGGGTLVGKRYAPADGSIELLCTKPGAGSLSVGTDLLPVMAAKVLPSSD